MFNNYADQYVTYSYLEETFLVQLCTFTIDGYSIRKLEVEKITKKKKIIKLMPCWMIELKE